VKDVTMTMMQLARVHGPNDVRIDEVAVPEPGPNDVVVRVEACGICGSDLGGPVSEPMPLGHEFAGTVDRVGAAVRDIAPGLRVAVNPDDRNVGNGGPEGAMAPFILVPDAKIGSSLYPVPAHVTPALAALAEPLSVALHGINLVDVKPTDKVVVLGAGPIGLCADREDSRLERAQQLGARTLINVTAASMTEALAEAHGEGNRLGLRYVDSDVFIDAAGAPQALAEVIAMAKFRARISVIALYKKDCPLNLFKMMMNEIMLIGSIALGRHAEFAEAIEMIAAGGIDLRPMISHSIPFSRFEEALDIARDTAGSAKVMLEFG
jgi:threonine dehydrogenase-like Zn-dependent dehydrogenase